jgi:hypothetical protein
MIYIYYSYIFHRNYNKHRGAEPNTVFIKYRLQLGVSNIKLTGYLFYLKEGLASTASPRALHPSRDGYTYESFH